MASKKAENQLGYDLDQSPVELAGHPQQVHPLPPKASSPPVLFWSLRDQALRGSVKDWLQSALPKKLRLQEEGSHEFRNRYLDTQDWRLWSSDRVLVHRQRNGGHYLSSWQSGVGEWFVEQAVDGQPVLPADLPHGAIGRHLPQWLGLRGLIAMAETTDRLRVLRVLDGEDKTVALLEIHEERNERGPLEPWLWLRAVRGYRDEARRISRNLYRQLGLEPLARDPLLYALADGPRQAGDYTGKLRLRLRPDTRADRAARQVLLTLLDAVEDNVAGACEAIDTEFLHDLRVAVRRSRSFLAGVKGVLPETRIGRFRDGLSWLQGVTGEGRDLDVYLLDFPRFRQSLSADQAEALEPFRDFLIEARARAYAELAGHSRGKRFQTLVRDWRAFLQGPVPRRSPLRHAMRPIGEVARLRIAKAWKRVLTDGGVITRESPAEALHELRKRCKRLRYLMEFFAGLFDSDAIGNQIRALKRLQEVLGEFQDRQVQHDRILDFERAMKAADRLPEPTAQAMEALAAGLIRDQDAVRERFYVRFAAFSAKKERKAFRAMLVGKS